MATIGGPSWSQDASWPQNFRKVISGGPSWGPFRDTKSSKISFDVIRTVIIFLIDLKDRFGERFGSILAPSWPLLTSPTNCLEGPKRAKIGPSWSFFGLQRKTRKGKIWLRILPNSGGPQTPVKTEGFRRFAYFKSMIFQQFLTSFWPLRSDLLGPLGGFMLPTKLLFGRSKRGSKTI